MSEAGLPGIWTSADGMSWAQEATPEAGTPSPIARSIISVDGGFVGVGSRGTTVDDATMVVWHGTPAP
jgi:hypothetical protein